MGTHHDLEQDSVRQSLVAAMAAGEPLGALAREHNVSRQALYLFKQRHADEIEALTQRVAAELTAMWVAVKAERVAAMMEDLEEAEARLSAPLHAEGEALGLEAFLALGAFKRAHLRAVAEELGQIPNKVTMQVGGSIVTYRLEGGDGRSGQELLDAI
jgi:hypothetical protein